METFVQERPVESSQESGARMKDDIEKVTITVSFIGHIREKSDAEIGSAGRLYIGSKVPLREYLLLLLLLLQSLFYFC